MLPHYYQDWDFSGTGISAGLWSGEKNYRQLFWLVSFVHCLLTRVIIYNLFNTLSIFLINIYYLCFNSYLHVQCYYYYICASHFAIQNKKTYILILVSFCCVTKNNNIFNLYIHSHVEMFKKFKVYAVRSNKNHLLLNCLVFFWNTNYWFLLHIWQPWARNTPIVIHIQWSRWFRWSHKPLTLTS